MPTGLSSSTTNTVVILEELMISSALLASMLEGTVLGFAVITSARGHIDQSSAHVAAQIAIRYNASQLPRIIGYTKASKAFLGHHNERLAHFEIAGYEGQGIALVHEIAHIA